ncbi:hypothetical protein [Flintibacter muris]|uniref:hypothetical protein n=1 Tax=Flintibacter muris TaxID=2941327 RepID=UPI00203D6FCB|nr:hypothetical protein [Flintibacter muris]
MSEIEKMQRYIERTELPADLHDKYCFCLGELDEVWKFSQTDMFSALCLLFEYGKAKGYRAAKAERRAVV